MSYVSMDHAGWVERCIGPGRAQARKPKKDAFGHVVGWHAAPDKLNRFQARVMDICGMVFGGIYNAPIAWDTVVWHPRSVHLTLRHGHLATVDFGNLTRLVFLCHEARIRAELAPHGRCIRLSFHHRDDSRALSTGHPNLAEAVDAFRDYLGEGHRIVFDKAQDDLEPERAEGRRILMEHRGRELFDTVAKDQPRETPEQRAALRNRLIEKVEAVGRDAGERDALRVFVLGLLFAPPVEDVA